MPDGPSSFLVVGFASSAAAEEALADVRARASTEKVSFRDAAVVTRTARGEVELEQSHELALGETVVGAGTAGLVAGLLLGLPIGGALLGLAGGTALGLRDTGIPDDRMRKLGAALTPGESLLCVLVDAEAAPQVQPMLARYGTVVETPLSSESER